MKMEIDDVQGSRSVCLRLVFALCLVAPAIGQNEADPYFSLSSNRNFGSTEKPEIMLSGWQVPAVTIRVYRLKDPEKFVSGLEDSHNFGERMPRPRGKLTLLERLHQWKRGMRRDIRWNLRQQFTESPRAHLTGTRTTPSRLPASAAATKYADAPVLNSEQLVLSFTQPVSGKNRWGTEAVAVPVKEKGLFLVEAVREQLRAYTILVVSDTVLVTKAGRGRVLTFLAERNSGEPIPNTTVIAAVRNKEYGRTKTDSDGLAEIPAVSVSGADDLRLLAVRGKDIALSAVSSWNFSPDRRNVTGLIYTDRPVYRPGDTMHFRGILRIQQSVGYQIPKNVSIPVQITDPDGKAIFQTNLTSNSNGIIHDEFAIPRGAALGSYYVQATSGEAVVTGNFEVQEYKKPEYEVRVSPDKARVLQGATVSATIDARYYFGEPVNGGKVKYSIYRSRYFYPLWNEPDEDSEPDAGGDAYDDAAGEQISQAEGRLDSEGKLSISIPTTVSDNKIDYRYRIEAGVTDKAGREISGSGWLIATFGDFVLNVQPDRYFYQPGTTGAFKIEARDYDSRPISTGVQVRLESWLWREHKASKVVSKVSAATDSNGSTQAELPIPNGGEYFRVVASSSSGERTVETSAYIWVAGPGEGFGSGERQQTVQIVPDKKTYRPGDLAKVLVITGRSNTPVLVTVEGRDIRSRQILRSAGATAVFEYRVSAEDEPGFFVSAAFIRSGQLYASQKRIKVPPEEHKLDIQVSTDKETYLPGQTARYSLTVKTADGKPAPGADLSLSVVDEAIYAIRRDSTPDLLTTFYGQEWNSIYTESSLSYFFSGEAGTRRMQLASLRRPSQLAQLKPERMVQPKVRKAFPDTAFWAQDLVTNSAGHAEARVNFPDSLTTWRATARGATADDRFGSATAKTIVRKNLLVRLALPRFFVQGDEVVVSAVVHNYLASAKHARVSLNLSGLEFVDNSGAQEAEIPIRGESKFDWRVKAQPSVRQAKVTGQVLTDEESDAVEFELPVNPPGLPVRQAKGGTIGAPGATALSFSFPQEAVPGSRSISVRMSSSVAGSLFSALDYLTSFPYGCVEQTMSSFLPDVIVTKAIGELGLKQPADPAALAEKIQAGLDRLYSFQHEDGGWGWWQSDESHPFMTAYVIAGFSDAKSAGLQVKDDVIARGVAWLAKELATGKAEDPDLRAYLLYSLVRSGSTNKSDLTESYQNRARLSPYGMALLGLAFDQLKDPRAAELAGQLERSAKQNAEEAWWPANRDAMLDLDADVTPEASAYALKLLAHKNPNGELLPKAALWLVNHRNEGYWWSSSKQTAMVIYGLIDYVKTTKELQPDFRATVSVDGKQVASQQFGSNSPAEAPELILDEGKLQAGSNQIQVTTEGKGRLYYSVSAVHYSNASRMEKQGAVSLNLLRDYFRLTPVQENGRIVYNLDPLNGPVSSGDTVAVRLTVTGSDWKYLLLEDPIPAGSEFIEKDNLYEIRNRPPWWRYWFTRRELHDDRMAIFQTVFNEGQQQYFYLLKIVNPGLFHLSPARVQPMYQPGMQATTEGRMLEAR